ncbi:hypothetical protein SLE2022_150020 [Rubroshorea leprosula]
METRLLLTTSSVSPLPPLKFTPCCHINPTKNRALARKIMKEWKQKGRIFIKGEFVDCASLIQALSKRRLPHLAQELLLEMKSEGLAPNNSTLCALMLCYAENEFFSQSEGVWDEMLNSSWVPSIQLVSELMDAYAKMGHFDKVKKIMDQVISRNFDFVPDLYSVAISCFGKLGKLELMENTLKEMVARGFPVDSATGNTFIRYYSIFGSLTEMETSYGRLKRSRHLIEEEGIRAMSIAYIRERKFYRLSEFLRDVGLERRNVGNLLWNLLLLSFAVNFKMKTLQREFIRMLDAGFRPDLTTFNIRALAFSRMNLFWDLHLSLEHMKHESVVSDLVTYGCLVDAYLDRRLAKNLNFALNKMNVDDSPLVSTDPLVFEAMGKGDFHLSSEAVMEFNRQKKWTYRQLIAIYLKKQYRRNQIFWNY